MYKNIYNNAAAREFFSSTVLDICPQRGLLQRMAEILRPCQNRPLNINIYSDYDELVDFCFALAAAAALSGRVVAFVTPTPQDFSLHNFAPLPGASSQLAAAELNFIRERLLILRSDAPLPRSYIDLAVLCPASAYLHPVACPFVAAHCTRIERDGELLVLFSLQNGGFSLAAAGRWLSYSLQQKLSFAPNSLMSAERALAQPQMMARSRPRRAKELAQMLCLRDIDGLSLACGQPCALGFKFRQMLLPLDLSPMQISSSASFKILPQPSF